MTEITLYGIKNCDTIKKARKWLDDNNIQYRFHDYRSHGCDREQLAQWCKQTGWETLLNRRGTTWRQLSESDKVEINQAKAIDLMCRNPAMIKRPVLTGAGELLVGFNVDLYRSALI